MLAGSSEIFTSDERPRLKFVTMTSIRSRDSFRIIWNSREKSAWSEVNYDFNACWQKNTKSHHYTSFTTLRITNGSLILCNSCGDCNYILTFVESGNIATRLTRTVAVFMLKFHRLKISCKLCVFNEMGGNMWLRLLGWWKSNIHMIHIVWLMWNSSCDMSNE